MINLHKQIATINRKLLTLDERTQQQREGLCDVRQQTRLIGQMLNVRMQESTHR